MAEEGCSELAPVLVLDVGSLFCKVGFGGEDFPRAIFPSVVGVPKIAGSDAVSNPAGDDAVSKKSLVTLKYPLERGIVQNWDDMERLWHHAFYNELRVAPEEHPVLLTEGPLNPKANRQRMVQIMFETFNVPAMFIAIQPLLALYASGRTTGTVLDLGDTVSHAVPIYEGFAIPGSIVNNEVGGRELTEYMTTLLAERQSKGHDRTQLQELKEKLCFVAADFDSECHRITENDEERAFKFLNGTVVQVGVERCQCPEALFQPSLVKDGVQGLHQAVHQAIKSSDVDIRRELFGQVVVTGGTSLFEGLDVRLATELRRLAPSTMDVNVFAPPERRYSVWMGGSILSCLSTFEGNWILREEYNSSGPDIVKRKCF